MKKRELDACKKTGWTVYSYGDGKVKVSKTSPAGTLVVLDVKAEDFAKCAKKFAKDFNADGYAVDMWVKRLKRDGGADKIPSITAYYNDAENIAKILRELAKALEESETVTEKYTVIPCLKA